MKLSFKYKQAGLWYRPIIPVTLYYKNREVTYLALIDSGADFSIFHSDLVDILGIDLSKLKKITFAGISKTGKPCQGSFVELSLGVGENIVKTMVVFSDDISDEGYGILGQQGFFNMFRVTFDYLKRDIEVITTKKPRKRQN